MAAYPTSPGHKTIARRVNQHTTRIMEDGSRRNQNWTDVEAWQFTLIHRPITQAEFTTLDSFYDTNRDSVNTVAWRGDTYSFRFRSGGYRVRDITSGYVQALVIVDAYI